MAFKKISLPSLIIMGLMASTTQAQISVPKPTKIENVKKTDNDTVKAIGPAYVDLRVNVGESPDDVYENRTAIQIPATHTIGDNLFPYEGIGWENELIGYRLYLDERAVTDVFGKKTPNVSLNKIDYRSKYHDPAEWGQDVMHVGPSMGVGGLGLYRGENLERFGKEGQIFAEVIERSGDQISFKIKHRNIPVSDGVVGNVDATYSMAKGSPLTWVDVVSTMPPITLASGLSKAPNSIRLKEAGKTTQGQWRYIAIWGDTRSEAKDGLGTVLFYRHGDGQLKPQTNETFVVRFPKRRFKYAFGAVWQQGPQGVNDEASFIKWVEDQYKNLPK